MGAWGALAFDNDTANDWAYGLDDAKDLSLVQAAIAAVIDTGDEYLDADISSEALAACEVVARLLGNPGDTNAYTEKVDEWVAAHPQQIPTSLRTSAIAVVDRVLTDPSELMELWSEGPDEEWRAAMADLRRRLTT